MGIRHNGVVIFDSDEVSSVMADCCLYDWFENGKNRVQLYVETHPARPGTDESDLLNAYTQAKYRVLRIQSAVPDAGVYCTDGLTHEEFFLMDLGLSRSTDTIKALATRTIPLGGCWMTGGAALPITSGKALKHALSGADSGKHELLAGPGGFALLIVRALLADGVADHVAYASVGTQLRKPRIEPRFQGSKRRRRLT